jgi:site-specific recombinase XerD
MAVARTAPLLRPFEHHVLDFLAYLEFERGLSRNTLEAYRSSSATSSPATASTRRRSAIPSSRASSRS